MKTLVVGATGLVGMEAVKLLTASGQTVRAVVRVTADRDKRARLEETGAEIVTADLKDSESLRAACKDVQAVISTASAVGSRHEGDSIETVDRLGQLALVDEAVKARVKRFVFTSFAPIVPDFALQRAKREVESRLQDGAIGFTIFQAANFAEVWLPMFGFDSRRSTARILGSGEQPVSWISIHDVARFVVAAAAGGPFADAVIPLGGPEPLTFLQVLKIFEETSGTQWTSEHIPEAALEAQLASATTSLEEAFAVLMLGTARGFFAVDSSVARGLLPGNLVTVGQYAKSIFNAS